MKIGIIGSGNIGGNLGKHWAKAGQEVMFSSRHPEELKSMADEEGAKVGTTEEAATFGEVILLAIPYGKVPDLAQQVGSLQNKILIDAGNPYPSRDGDMAQKVIDDESQTATGYVASQFPGAKTVKAFNSIYFKVLEEQAFRSGDDRIAVQVCGDNGEAKKTVMQLIADIGFAPQDLGDLSQGILFEPNAPLYNKNLKIREAEKLLSEIK
ncbi:MAG: NADPH-dependent F420 reductase [Waterburya sp.]